MGLGIHAQNGIPTLGTLQAYAREKWRWLLIDEYQDCNPAQVRNSSSVGIWRKSLSLTAVWAHSRCLDRRSTSSIGCVAHQTQPWDCQVYDLSSRFARELNGHTKRTPAATGVAVHASQIRIAEILQAGRGQMTVVGNDAQSVYRSVQTAICCPVRVWVACSKRCAGKTCMSAECFSRSRASLA